MDSDKKEDIGREQTFEESLEQLEGIVEKLERGQLGLDESLDTFEEGMRLASLCSNKLSKVERRVEQLIERNGELKTEPFLDTGQGE